MSGRETRGALSIGARLASEAPAWALAGTICVLFVWQQQARRSSDVSDAPPNEPYSAEVTLSGVAVPGSLERRWQGDPDGLSHCESTFQLRRAGQVVQVRWAVCELPAALAAELRRSFSPLERVADVRISLRGSWRGSGEFEALGLRSPP